MQINAIRKMVGVAAVMAVLAGTTAVNAQSQAQGEGGGFDQPLKSAKKSKVQSSAVLTENDGEHTYSVRVEGDKVTAEVDGEPVPKDRIRRRDGRVEILDQNKEVIKSFNVRVGEQVFAGPLAPTAPQAPAQRRFRVETVEPGAQGMGGMGGWVAEEPPKAMIGIMMTDAGDDDGALIDSVMDGLPADKAGLKPGDVVIEANGKRISGQQELREIIREASPDDTINLKVERDGKPLDLKVKLTKWDQSKVKVTAQGMPFTALMLGGSENLDAARESIESAIGIIKDSDKLDAKTRERVQASLEAALKNLDQARKQSNLMLNDNVEGQMRVFGPQGRAFTVPSVPPAGVNADLAKRLERLNEQLERMNKRMEELEKSR